jgi:hypothetical protein
MNINRDYKQTLVTHNQLISDRNPASTAYKLSKGFSACFVAVWLLLNIWGVDYCTL